MGEKCADCTMVDVQVEVCEDCGYIVVRRSHGYPERYASFMKTEADNAALQKQVEGLREALAYWRGWCEETDQSPVFASDRHYLLYDITVEALQGGE